MSAPDHIDAALLADLQDLASISLSAEEAEALREKLQRVVAFLAEIDEVEIPEPGAAEPAPRLRRDETDASLSHELALESAPLHQGRFFRVLPVLPTQNPADSDESPTP